MGLLAKAYETYEHHRSMIGVGRDGFSAMVPVGHILQKAQITISLDSQGKFIGAQSVQAQQKSDDEKDDDVKTIIPATEESANRTSKIAPHPLSDQLKYLACDKGAKDKGDHYNAYLEGLKKWAASEYSHPKLTPILAYIEGGTILQDLAKAKLIELDDQGRPAKGSDKYLVRWEVQLGDDTGEAAACWKDKSLFEAFENYYRSQKKEVSVFCMLSGKTEPPVQSHPKGIIASSYGAKLISSNDDTGFTFRGRFTDADQACTVGYEASQKAHSALQWLALNQGVMMGEGRTFLCWNPEGHDVPPIMTPLPIVPLEESDPEEQGLEEEEEAPISSNYKKRLARTLAGFKKDLPDHESVIIAVFDAATTGRLSLTYYQELAASAFLERVEHWYGGCAFPYLNRSSADAGAGDDTATTEASTEETTETAGRDPKKNAPISTPSLFQIVECAYGVERQGSLRLELDERLKKEQLQRLLPCVVEKAPIPLDLAAALANRASRLLVYSPRGLKGGYYSSNRHRVLFTACAVIRKARNDRIGKEEWTMELDPQKEDRSYQFGRLLALMEKVERDTYEKDETREPNAIRLQELFRTRPLYGADLIHRQLAPYFARLSPGLRSYYKRTIGEVFEIIDRCCASSLLERPLEDTYLLGYYLQRQELYRKKAKDQPQNEESQNDNTVEEDSNDQLD